MRSRVLRRRNLGLAGLLLVAQTLYSQITFGPAQPAAPQNSTRPEDRCTVEGHIRDALTQEAIARASVQVREQQSGQGYFGISSSDGSFRIENIPPGQYRILASRYGYLSAQYGARKPEQPGPLAVLTPGQHLTGINIALTPQALVTGKVVDQDGDPVSYANVSLLARTWQRGRVRYWTRGGGNTNDAGEYRISAVSAGKYYVLVSRPGYV